MKIKLSKSEVIDLMYAIEAAVDSENCHEDTAESIGKIHDKLQRKLYGNRLVDAAINSIEQNGDAADALKSLHGLTEKEEKGR